MSTRSVVLTGYPLPHPDLAGDGTPGGVPGGYPTLVPPILTWLGGTLAGYPPAGSPSWTWQGTPLAGVPPGWTWQGTPPRCLPHGILGNVPKHYGIWVTPLWTDRQTRVKV